LHIIHEVFRVGLLRDYVYDKQYVTSSPMRTISLNPQVTHGIHPHFSTPDDPSQVVLDIALTENDYDNMQYIVAHRNIFNMLIKKYSSLDIEYPDFSHEDVHNIPTSFSLSLTFDHLHHTVVVDNHFSPQKAFVLLYFQTLELLQICVDVYNEFERSKKDLPLFPLKNGVAFVSSDRSLRHIPHIVDPRSWNILIADKQSSSHHAYL